MKKILFAVAAVALLAGITAYAQFGFGAPQQQNGEPKAPELEYVVRLNVTLGRYPHHHPYHRRYFRGSRYQG